MHRLLALLWKEFTDLRHNAAVFAPALLVAFLSILLPFFVAIIVPAFSGERLSDSSDFELALEIYRDRPEMQALDPEGAVQAWIFQYFLVLLLLTPVTCSMSIAAYSVIGEKQARTLEPLLATPITTIELLGAKVLGALLPGVALTVVTLAVYLAAVAALARPGVFWILLTPRALMLLFVLGPLAALMALQLAVCVSSRVNDPRSAQQIGALVILPIAGMLVAQLMGAVQLTTGIVAIVAAVLAVLNLVLMRVAVTIFDRESILTRWK